MFSICSMRPDFFCIVAMDSQDDVPRHNSNTEPYKNYQSSLC